MFEDILCNNFCWRVLEDILCNNFCWRVLEEMLCNNFCWRVLEDILCNNFYYVLHRFIILPSRNLWKTEACQLGQVSHSKKSSSLLSESFFERTYLHREYAYQVLTSMLYLAVIIFKAREMIHQIFRWALTNNNDLQ